MPKNRFFAPRCDIRASHTFEAVYFAKDGYVMRRALRGEENFAVTKRFCLGFCCETLAGVGPDFGRSEILDLAGGWSRLPAVGVETTTTFDDVIWWINHV